MYTSTHTPMRTSQSTTFTVRLAEAAKARLEALARSTGRTRSHLAAEAIGEFLEDNEWQVAGIHQALASLEQGRAVDHAEVRDWVRSWGTDSELPAPQPRGL